MSASCVLHSGRHCRIRQSGFRAQILRCERQEMAFLHGGGCFGRYSCRLLLHHPAVVHEYLQTGRRLRPCHRLSLFRPCHQHFVDYPDRPYLGHRDGDCTDGRSHTLFSGHRPCNGIYFPQGGESQERGTDEYRTASRKTPDVADLVPFLHAGSYPCVCELGHTGGFRYRVVVQYIYLQVVHNRRFIASAVLVACQDIETTCAMGCARRCGDYHFHCPCQPVYRQCQIGSAGADDCSDYRSFRYPLV